MPKFFGIGKHAGELCVSQTTDTYAEAVRSGLDVVVATDAELVQHVQRTIAAAQHPLHTLAVAFHGLVGLYPQRVQAARFQQKLPRPGLYPSNINPHAVRIWDNVFKMDKYASAIAFKTPIQVWAIASRYFRDLCMNAGVNPYKDEMNPDFDLRDFVAERVRLVKSRLEQIYRHLDAGQVAIKQSPWNWTKFEADDKHFYVVATKNIGVQAKARVKIDDVLKKYEGVHSKPTPGSKVVEHMHYAVTPDSAVYLDYQPKQKRIVAEMHIQIPYGMVLKTLRLARPKSKDEEKRALKLLEALVQAWSHGELKAVVASVTVPKLSGAAYVADVLNKYLRTEQAATASAGSFSSFYDALLSTMSTHERTYFVGALQADPSLMGQLHRFNLVNRKPAVVTAAATKQLRTLVALKVYKHGHEDFEPEEADKATLELPAGSVLLPKVDEDADELDSNAGQAAQDQNREYYIVLHPEKLHRAPVVLSPEQRKRCADIENNAETFDGSIAAAFEMLVEKFNELQLLRSDTEAVVKSLGPVETWPYATNRVWMHHLNLKSTHPGLTFDVVDAAGSKHLAAIYSGVW